MKQIYKNYYTFCNNPTLNTFNNFLKSIPTIHSKINIKKNANIIIDKLKEKHLINGKLSIHERQSPILSATCFPEGYVLFNIINKNIPLYKNKLSYSRENLSFWIIVSYNGIKKWVPFVNKFGINIDEPFEYSKKTTKFIMPRSEKKYFDKIANIYINKMLFVGEYIIHSWNVPSGKYEIYNYKYACVICPENSFDKIFTNFFVKTHKYVGVDGGTYGFYNGDIFNMIRTYFEKNHKPRNGKRITQLKGELILRPEWENHKNNEFIIKKSTLINNINYEWSYDDIDNNALITKINKYPLDIAGVLIRNGFGDGTFPIFQIKKENIFIICSSYFIEHLYDEINYFFI